MWRKQAEPRGKSRGWQLRPALLCMRTNRENHHAWLLLCPRWWPLAQPHRAPQGALRPQTPTHLGHLPVLF